MNRDLHNQDDLRTALLLVSRALIKVIALLFISTLVIVFVSNVGLDRLQSFFKSKENEKVPAPLIVKSANEPSTVQAGMWIAPDIEDVIDAEVLYGRDLIANTAIYFGPKGKIAQITNGMNCQNCHLEAGTKVFGNNYSAVFSTYPKMRARSGKIESVEKRINDCFERSLNGKAIPDSGREMKAMLAYMKWVGSEVVKGDVPGGSGLPELEYLDRPADPEKGKALFEAKCKVCHGANGNGLLNADGTAYTYPPLWGNASYNHGAGLFRLSRFAGYVKANMPQGATYDNPQLSDEEAWDLAAFVNSQPRPGKDLKADWPDISKKPIDHPFGPFADSFTEEQHKYGPFKPIKKLKAEVMASQSNARLIGK